MLPKTQKTINVRPCLEAVVTDKANTTAKATFDGFVFIAGPEDGLAPSHLARRWEGYTQDLDVYEVSLTSVCFTIATLCAYHGADNCAI